MPRPKTPANLARESMRTLGVYKPEFEKVIEIYAGLIEQYNELSKKFADSGYRFSEETENGSKKAPIVTTLESLRKDILSYASQLGLTPQGLLRSDPTAFAKKKVSRLAAALEGVK